MGTIKVKQRTSIYQVAKNYIIVWNVNRRISLLIVFSSYDNQSLLKWKINPHIHVKINGFNFVLNLKIKRKKKKKKVKNMKGINLII